MRDVGLPTAGVAYVPLGAFFPVTEQANHARFNYLAQPIAHIRKGIAALGNALKQRQLP